MHADIPKETIDALEEVAKAVGGELHITKAIICDHCKNEDEEAFPYNVYDIMGKFWVHLCNDCYDVLGCFYFNAAPICPKCGGFMEWEDCWNGCDDGYLNLYDEDPMWYDEDDLEECTECKGKGGYWACPQAATHNDQAEEVT